MSRYRLLWVFALGCLLAVAAPAPAAAARSYEAAVVYDPQSETFLRAWRADVPLPPASLTKMATALVVARRLGPDTEVRISRAAATAPYDSVRWPEGATFAADDVLHGMMMMSSNGAAIALAEATAGSVRAFLPMMNERARRAGATRSRFLTPHGLDARGQRSTARDLALIGAEVLRNPWLMRVISTRNHDVVWPDGSTVRFGNLNRLMYQVPGVIGIKPGYTRVAGNCLAAAALRDGRMMVAVVLDDPNVLTDARRLLEAGFRTAAKGPAWDGPTPEQETPEEARAREIAEEPPPAPAASATPPQRSTPWPRPGRILLHLVAWTAAWGSLRRVLETGRKRPLPRRRRRRALRASAPAVTEATLHDVPTEERGSEPGRRRSLRI